MLAKELSENDAVFRIKIPENTIYCDGHFQGDAILPGVAQLVTLSEQHARKAWPTLGFVSEVKRLKFMVALRPSDELEVRLTRKSDDDGSKVKFEIYKDVEKTSMGTLYFSGQ